MILVNNLSFGEKNTVVIKLNFTNDIYWKTLKSKLNTDTRQKPRINPYSLYEIAVSAERVMNNGKYAKPNH